MAPLLRQVLRSLPHTFIIKELFHATACRMSSIVEPSDLKGLDSSSSLAPISSHPKKVNAWSAPGPSAFDFRSDTITTPTASMLAAISNTTLSDDVFQEDETTNSFQDQLASLTKHEAALFVLSGTMGNQLAMRSHLTQPPYSILGDYRAHVLEWEAGGIGSLCGAMTKQVVPANGVYLTVEDVEKYVTLGDEVHGAPTRVITLENTLGGTIMPLEEVKKISRFAREHDIKLHMDGARLWEAVVAGAGSLSDYTELCDSVSLCFSKGLGAPVGSMLVGSKSFIKQARWVRKSVGGGTRQIGVLTAAARVSVEETFGKGVWGEGGLLKNSHIRAKKIVSLWESFGGHLSKPTETNMVWLDLERAGVSNKEFSEMGKAKGLKLLSGRLVVHYQVSDEAIQKLSEIMEEVFKRGNGEKANGGKVGEKAYGT